MAGEVCRSACICRHRVSFGDLNFGSGDVDTNAPIVCSRTKKKAKPRVKPIALWLEPHIYFTSISSQPPTYSTCDCFRVYAAATEKTAPIIRDCQENPLITPRIFQSPWNSDYHGAVLPVAWCCQCRRRKTRNTSPSMAACICRSQHLFNLRVGCTGTLAFPLSVVSY